MSRVHIPGQRHDKTGFARMKEQSARVKLAERLRRLHPESEPEVELETDLLLEM